MAKDVSSKHNVSSSAGDSSSSSLAQADKQKVPPLRIVLNTSGNQKISTSGGISSNLNIANQVNQQQQQDLNKASSQDANSLKGPGKLKNKFASSGKQNSSSNKGKDSDLQSSANPPDATTEVSKASTKGTELKEVGTSSAKDDSQQQHTSHLRRITRRSQRANQAINNEDDESMTSMTSVDDTATNANDNNSVLENTDSTNNQSSSIGTSASAGSGTVNSASETPKRHKRRKLDTSESQLSEYDGIFNYSNYRLPMQNSFELFKNIRKQIDTKLGSMTNVHPKTPHGFRDYMLTRGAYLLDGNRLGNGTNLFMNEDGGLHLAPIGKYHVLRTNKLNYSVPNRAKVPLGLPVSSPLYNLFIEQEKERYRMRIQHIKEREKLTLAAEQEIVRVYSQAAMAAANQTEPLSACTMLMHQEIYNSIESDSPTNPQEDEEAIYDAETNGRYSDRVRTRRRNATTVSEHSSPLPPRKTSNADENQLPNQSSSTSTSSTIKTDAIVESNKATNQDQKIEENQASDPGISNSTNSETDPPLGDTKVKETSESSASQDEKSPEEKVKSPDRSKSDEPADSDKLEITERTQVSQIEIIKSEEAAKLNPAGETEISGKPQDQTEAQKQSDSLKPDAIQQSDNPCQERPDEKNCVVVEDLDRASSDSSSKSTADKSNLKSKEAEGDLVKTDTSTNPSSMPDKSSSAKDDLTTNGEVSNEEAKKNNDALETKPPEESEKEIQEKKFVAQLQEIDDKWDKIRNEMLIRHINEADSLHSIQKLEWEWKTKEIGFCDVRTTPVIDETLVPKLIIQPQDY